MPINEHEIFKALSEPIRLRIINLLLDGELCICDLIDSLKLPQSTLSRHMTRLKHAGLVSGRRAGRWNYYCLITDDNSLLTGLEDFFKAMATKEPYQADLKRLRSRNLDKVLISCDRGIY